MHWPRLLHGHLLTLYLWCWCLWYLRYQPRLHGYPSFGVPIVQFFAVLLFDNFSRGTWVWGPCPVFLNKWKNFPSLVLHWNLWQVGYLSDRSKYLGTAIHSQEESGRMGVPGPLCNPNSDMRLSHPETHQYLLYVRA